MGIRGLTTYIAKRSDRYLEPHELRDCSIVIDGNNLASHLYSWVSKCNCAFGGDYDKYANCVEHFFAVLAKCHVTPVVLFDGGYETKKLSTVHERFRNKVSAAKLLTPAAQSKLSVFPLFMKDVFKDVLVKLHVPFVQCDFEADSEIAVVARNLNCPVLSYDSDFFVYDVLYIPFSTVSLEPVRDESARFYISCKIYKVDKFLDSLGGLDKSLLPVMAALLGNDYIERTVFKNFLSQIKVPKYRSMSKTQRRIIALLHWLRRETVESAVQKILSRMKKSQREVAARQLEEVILGYTTRSSDLLPYLLPSVKTSSAGKYEVDALVMGSSLLTIGGSKVLSEDLNDFEDGEQTDASSDTSEDRSDSVYCEKSVLLRELFPDWFKESLRRGNLPPCFTNMLVHRIYFAQPQVEDFSQMFSHQISLPILSVIYGLLTAQHVAFEDLSCFARKQTTQVEKLLVRPVYETPSVSKFPLLEEIPETPATSRKALLYDAVGFCASDVEKLNSFPDDWKIFIVALIYWGRNTCLSSCYIHAVLFSILILKVLEGHTGYYSLKKAFSKQKRTKVRKTDKSCCEKDDDEKMVGDSEPSCASADAECNGTVSEAVAKVSTDECLMLVESLMQHRVMDENLRCRPKLFSVAVVHTFAQLQSCLLHVMHLNALLCFPLPQCLVADFYSGTLIYNMCVNFKKRIDIEVYVCTHLFSCAPSLTRLYKVLVASVLGLIPDTIVVRKPKRKARKRTKQKSSDELEYEETRNSDSCEDDELSDFVLNNRFFALSLSRKT